jgi:SAM-dependent methyltransferase
VLLDAFKIPRDSRGRRVAFLGGCRECGLLFANPLPTKEDLARRYSPGGSYVEARKALAAKPPAREAGARDPRDLLLEALTPYVPVHAPSRGAKVLDFGCGDGKFLNRLQNAGWETYGVEPSTSAAFARHRRLDRPPQDGSFDFAILHHVLEHVTDPLDILRQLAGALREGGVLFIGVPRFDALPQHGDFKYCLDGRNHLICLSESCLVGLLGRVGLTMTARLDSRELDEAITQGRPLRLRLVATRTAAGAAQPDEPLRAAIRTWRLYRTLHGTSVDVLGQALPVRLRGALLDQAIERRARARRRARAAAEGMKQLDHRRGGG